MFTSLSPCRSALPVGCLVFAVVLLAGATNSSRAGDITYNIVDYPMNELDDVSGNTDTLSGTMILNPSGDIVGGTVILDTSEGTFTASFPAPTVVFFQGIVATPTQLLLYPGGAEEMAPALSGGSSGSFLLSYNNEGYGLSDYYSASVRKGQSEVAGFGYGDPYDQTLSLFLVP